MLASAPLRGPKVHTVAMPHSLRPPLLLCALLIASVSQPCPAQRVGSMERAPVTGPAGPLARPPSLPSALQRIPRVAQTAIAAELQTRELEIHRHLRLHRDVLDTDTRGAPVVRGEVVAIDPAPGALDRVRGAGFTVTDDRMLDELNLRIVVLRSPRGVGTRQALRQLRRLDPVGTYDFNHVYFGSAAITAGATLPSSSIARSARALRVGLIDSGVSRDHPGLAGVDIRGWGCDEKPHPDTHGTAVASLLVGNQDGEVVRGSVLYAADIYCGQPAGGAVTGFAEAMAWLARERVGVINLSLVGPHNQLLQRATQALAARGHVLVAAVGNDGPAAPALYPAAYPEVIGVTAVDPRERVLPEAGRGQHVDFAAPGSELRAARPSGDWGTVRGTSFAAPLVARAAARLVDAPGHGQAARVRAQLAAEAVDLGPKGRDNTYGHGLLGAEPPGGSVGPAERQPDGAISEGRNPPARS